MKITFLHVSDLHYRPDWHEESELVLTRFGEDLKGEAPKYQNLYLIFSGDLVQAGSNQDFYSRFIVRADDLFTAAGMPRTRRISVPGNHDVSQDAVKPILPLQIGALNGLTSESIFNDSMPHLSEMFF